MIKNEAEAVEFIYRSYLAAEPGLRYEASDREKRHPELTGEMLSALCRNDRNVLVTGSKGKGSTAFMLSAVLEGCGIRTGLFTGPHISEFRERIRDGSGIISEEDFVRYAALTEHEVSRITAGPGEYISPVGIECAVALHFFNDRKTDWNIFECGKGVATDDTRNIPHSYAIINTVFAEHMRELGPALADIAENKAAAIQPGMKCAYTAKQSPEVYRILSKRAEECGVELKSSGKDFFADGIVSDISGVRFNVHLSERTYTDLRVPMLGEYQARNAALALAAAADIAGLPDEGNVRKALSQISVPGRMEIISRSPFTVLDACINRSSAESVRSAAKMIPHRSCAAVIAIPDDKDYAGVAGMAGEFADALIFTDTASPHYRFSEKQLDHIGRYKDRSVYIHGSEKALEYAVSKGFDLIFLLGTTSFVSEIRQSLH